METRTYFASSVPEAIELASRELGPDAMLLMSRPAPPEYRERGRVEVTFGFESGSLPMRADGRLRPVERARESGMHAPGELDSIRDELTALRIAIDAGAGEGRRPIQSDEIRTRTVLERLTACGLSQGFALEVARDVASSGAPAAQVTFPVGDLLRVISDRLEIAPPASLDTDDARTIAFIGPHGRGKTTSLVKVAMKYGLFGRVPVKMFSVGVHSVGGREQMARFASILGVPCVALESYASVGLALAGEQRRGLLLLDTPGISPGDEEESRDLAGFLSNQKEIEKHLVIRADSGTAETLAVIERFSGMRPSRLLITGFDEAVRVAPLIEVLCRSSIPVTWIGTGSRIPGDLDVIDRTSLLKRFEAEVRFAEPQRGLRANRAAA